MSLRVLVLPDKYKGTLTARAAAKAIAVGWHSARPRDQLELLPMSDGGDGFGEVMSALLGAKPQTVRTADAAHRPLKATWWWEPCSRTAIVESAKIVGLALLPQGKFHPFELDTFGLGAVLQAAADKGARRCIVGIGGSATNDGGLGLARALGWQFLDREGKAIERWTELTRLTTVRPRKRKRVFSTLIVAVDVQNKLLGARGCSRIYGPQKGLRPEDMAPSERALRRLAKVMKQDTRNDFAAKPGAGAAGGLGFGLAAFLGARFQPGFDLFAREAKLAQRLRRADLVITGEGALDQSTLMGKGVGEVARRARKLAVPCIGLGGVVNDAAKVKRLFTEARGMTPAMTSVKQATKKPALWLERLAKIVSANWA
jgi:glycerate kinase